MKRIMCFSFSISIHRRRRMQFVYYAVLKSSCLFRHFLFVLSLLRVSCLWRFLRFFGSPSIINAIAWNVLMGEFKHEISFTQLLRLTSPLWHHLYSMNVGVGLMWKKDLFSTTNLQQRLKTMNYNCYFNNCKYMASIIYLMLLIFRLTWYYLINSYPYMSVISLN